MPKGKTLHIQGVVLGKTKLSEQDLILTLLTRDGSQMRVVAKAARKPGTRLSACSELFCQNDYLIYLGRNLGTVAEASLMCPHSLLQQDLNRVSAASVICEIARSSSFEDATDPFLYPICIRALTACEQSKSKAQLELVVAAYSFKVIAHGGWKPELDHCVLCGGQDISRFSVLEGGVLCESCARDIQAAELLFEGELSWLKSLIYATFDDLLSCEIGEDISASLLRLSFNWTQAQLDRRLKAFEFFLNL